MRRIYTCRNAECRNYGAHLIVTARPVGDFYEFPQLLCQCFTEPAFEDVGRYVPPLKTPTDPGSPS